MFPVFTIKENKVELNKLNNMFSNEVNQPIKKIHHATINTKRHSQIYIKVQKKTKRILKERSVEFGK